MLDMCGCIWPRALSRGWLIRRVWGLCTQMRGWCLYVCLHSTLYILAPCPQPKVFSAPLAWDRAKVGERRPGEVPQPSSHPPTCPIPPPVKCPILHSTVHLEYHSAPPLLRCSPPSPRTTQLGDTVNCNQRCRS